MEKIFTKDFYKCCCFFLLGVCSGFMLAPIKQGFSFFSHNGESGVSKQETNLRPGEGIDK